MSKSTRVFSFYSNKSNIFQQLELSPPHLIKKVQMFTNASFMPDEIYVVTTPVVKINQLFLFGNRTEPDIRFVDYRILSAEFLPDFMVQNCTG